MLSLRRLYRSRVRFHRDIDGVDDAHVGDLVNALGLNPTQRRKATAHLKRGDTITYSGDRYLEEANIPTFLERLVQARLIDRKIKRDVLWQLGIESPKRARQHDDEGHKRHVIKHRRENDEEKEDSGSSSSSSSEYESEDPQVAEENRLFQQFAKNRHTMTIKERREIAELNKTALEASIRLFSAIQGQPGGRNSRLASRLLLDARTSYAIVRAAATVTRSGRQVVKIPDYPPQGEQVTVTGRIRALGYDVQQADRQVIGSAARRNYARKHDGAPPYEEMCWYTENGVRQEGIRAVYTDADQDVVDAAIHEWFQN